MQMPIFPSLPRSHWERPSAKLRFAGTSVLNLFRLMQALPMRSGASRKCVPKQKLGHEEIGSQNPDHAGQTALDSPKGQFARMEL
jgi:hypothetical protein